MSKHVYLVCVSDVMIGTTCLENIARALDTTMIEVAQAAEKIGEQMKDFQELVFKITSAELSMLSAIHKADYEFNPVPPFAYKPRIHKTKYACNNYQRSGIRTARNMARSRA